MILKTIVIIIEILVSFLFQTTIFSHLKLADVVPDILMITTASLGYIVGKKTGALTGFVCGLLLDCTYGTLIGLYALMYTAIGYVCGFANRIYSEEDYTLPLFLIGGSEFAFSFIYYVLFYLLKGDLDFGHFSMRFLFPRVIYTVMVSIIIYRLLNLNTRLFDRIDLGAKKRKGGTTHEYKGLDIFSRQPKQL